MPLNRDISVVFTPLKENISSTDEYHSRKSLPIKIQRFVAHYHEIRLQSSFSFFKAMFLATNLQFQKNDSRFFEKYQCKFLLWIAQRPPKWNTLWLCYFVCNFLLTPLLYFNVFVSNGWYKSCFLKSCFDPSRSFLLFSSIYFIETNIFHRNKYIVRI